MPSIAIKPPVKVKTKGGLDATIFEIDPDDLQDGISGMVYTPGKGDIAKSWSDVGICSNAPDDLNIDPRDPAVVAVIDQLRAARPRAEGRVPMARAGSLEGPCPRCGKPALANPSKGWWCVHCRNGRTRG